MDSCHEDEGFECPSRTCSFTAGSRRELNAHKLAHDGINTKRWLPFSCPQCPARFCSSEDQTRHLEQQGTKQFTCPNCPESFFFKQGLEMHFDRAHAHESAPHFRSAFQCPHCMMVCKTSLGLEMHLRWRYMGACLAKLDDSCHRHAEAPASGQATPPDVERQPPCDAAGPMAVLATANYGDGSGNTTPVYAPVPTPLSSLLSASSLTSASVSTAATPREASPIQLSLAMSHAKPSLNQLAAAVAANYQEMLSPANSTDTAMGIYTPEDCRSKMSGYPAGLGFPGALPYRNGVVTPLSNNSPSATPLSASAPLPPTSELGTPSHGSPMQEELSPSSRLSMRNDKAHKHSCSDCIETFPSRELLNYHLRTAHYATFGNERKFECKTCFKVCTTQSGLDYHNRTHLKSIEERRAYKCQECSQVFTVRSTLYRHQRTQHAATLDERKPYKCIYCGKAFASRYNLNRHADTRHPGLSREPLK